MGNPNNAKRRNYTLYGMQKVAAWWPYFETEKTKRGEGEENAISRDVKKLNSPYRAFSARVAKSIFPAVPREPNMVRFGDQDGKIPIAP